MNEAIQFDEENDDTGWADAIKKEIDSIIGFNVFDFLPAGSRPPPGSRRIPVWLMFEMKMDGRKKARLIAGGHVTPTPVDET